jgi:ribosomal protein L37E
MKENARRRSVTCRRCGNGAAAQFQRVDSFERISLADDPADPNCGHYYIDLVYVMRCTACGHRQEKMEKRSPFQTLREAEKELDGHILGKG